MIARVQPLTTTRRLAGPFDYALPDAPVEVGSVVRVPFGRQALDGVVVGLAGHGRAGGEARHADRRAEDSVPAELVELALWMADEYCSTPARALSLVLPPEGGRGRSCGRRGRTPALDGERLTDNQRALLASLPRGPAATSRRCGGWRRAGSWRSGRAAPPGAAHVAARRPRSSLTAEQEAAVAAVAAAARTCCTASPARARPRSTCAPPPRRSSAGEGVIVLVPEIALTPQTVGRFQARFGDTVALLHSALGEGERYDEWRRLRTGEARIAVGPRSAVFAPVRDLGLIVVDEEHDPSYKHEGDPRYDAPRTSRPWRRARGASPPRRAARRLGHAAPGDLARLPQLTLPERVGSRPLPPVEVLDMRGARHPLHPDTRRALTEARKAILLLNRRGWSNFLTCRTCGKVWECPQCDVALVLHRAEHVVACHHCGHRERVPERCDACGSPSVARYGAGTERLEAELAEALDVPVFRLDADTAGRQGRGARRCWRASRPRPPGC